MPQDTLRLRILKALTDELSKISVSDGYNNDLEGHVFRGREHFSEDDPIPLVSVFEKVDADNYGATANGSGKAKTEIELRLQGFVEDDPYNPLDPAYRLLGDLQRCMTRASLNRNQMGERDILGMGGRVIDMHIGQGAAAPPNNEVSSFAFAFLPVKLVFVEDREKPFD